MCVFETWKMFQMTFLKSDTLFKNSGEKFVSYFHGDFGQQDNHELFFFFSVDGTLV